MSDTDAALVTRLRAGDSAAFEAVVVQHFTALARFAYGYVRDVAAAEDLVQDVFARVWEQHATLQPYGSLASYLHGAVRHRALDAIRRQKLEARVQAQELQEGAGDLGMDPAMSAIDRLAGEDDRIALRRAIAALPERRRIAIRLRYGNGMSHAEVGEVLGVSPKAAKELLVRALDALRLALR